MICVANVGKIELILREKCQYEITSPLKAFAVLQLIANDAIEEGVFKSADICRIQSLTF